MKILITAILLLFLSLTGHAQTLIDCHLEAASSGQIIVEEPGAENDNWKRLYFTTVREDGSHWYTGHCYIFKGNKIPYNNDDPRHEEPEYACNSIIDVDSLSVAETVDLVGTSEVLRYDTAYSMRPVEFTVKVQLTDSPYDPRLSHIDVGGEVAGQPFFQHFGTMANTLAFDLAWDGNDGSGNPVQGSAMATINVDHRYTGYSGLTMPQQFRVPMGAFRASFLGLGGLTISSVHYYDRVRAKMFTGDGRTLEVHAVHANEDLFGRLSNAGNSSTSFTYFLVPDHDADQAYIFSQNGWHLQTRSMKTNAILKQMTYDTSGRLTGIIDSYGNTISVSRPASDLIQVQAPHGKITKLHLDGNGRVIDIEDPKNLHYLMTYHGSGLIASFQKPGGAVNTFTFSPTGTLTRDEHSGGSILEFTKTNTRAGAQNFSEIRVVNAKGNGRNIAVATASSAAGYGRVSAQTAGGRISFNLSKNPSYKTYERVSPEGRVITDTKVQDVRFWTDVYYPNRTTVTSGNQSYLLVTNRADTFSSAGILTPTGITHSYAVAGNTTISNYVGSTQTETVTSPLGRTGSVKYNGFDRVVQAQLASFAPVDFGYDSAGRINLISQGARLTHFSYDPNGNLASITNPLGQSTSYTHDSNGQVLTTTLPDSRLIGTAYDANGNLSQIQTPAGVAHGLVSNAFDLLGSYVAPPMNSTNYVTSYTYNNARQLQKITKPDGSEINLVYDPAKEHLNQVVTPEGTTTYNYDYLGLLDRIDTTQGVTSFVTYVGDIPYHLRTTWTGVNATVEDSHTRFQQRSRPIGDSLGALSRVDLAYDNDDLLTA